MRSDLPTSSGDAPAAERIVLPGGWRFEPQPWPNGDARDPEDAAYALLSPDGEYMGDEWCEGDVHAFAAALDRAGDGWRHHRTPAQVYRGAKVDGLRLALGVVEGEQTQCDAKGTPNGRLLRMIGDRLRARIEDINRQDGDAAPPSIAPEVAP